MPAPKSTDSARLALLRAELSRLLEYGSPTEIQRKHLEAYARHGNAKLAANELGVTHQSVFGSINHVRKKAADRGVAPPVPLAIPETERIKGHSYHTDGSGAVDHAWHKTERATDTENAVPIINAPIVAQSVMTDSQGQTRINWSRREMAKVQAYELTLKALTDAVQPFTGRKKPVRRGAAHVGLSRGLLEVYTYGDPHIGMHAWAAESGDNFDLKIADEQLTAATDLVAERANPASEALVINLGDYFHANDDTQLTPGHKHKLSVDSRVGKVATVGFMLLHKIVSRLLKVHDRVTVWNVKGNHDPLLSVMLNMWLAAMFKDEPRVIVDDNFAPYFYRRHGKNLIGAAHGHLAPMRELGPIMSVDRREDWGQTEVHHWFTGHVHHDHLIEGVGFTAESCRTMAPKDDYAAGRYRSTQGLQAVTFHELYGIIARRRVGIELVRARLAGVL